MCSFFKDANPWWLLTAEISSRLQINFTLLPPDYLYLITLAPFNVSLAEIKGPFTEESALRRKWRVVKLSFTFRRPSRLPFGFREEKLMTDRTSASALLFCHSHTSSCWHLFLLTRSWWQRVWCHRSNLRSAQCAVESKQASSSHDPPLRFAAAQTTAVFSCGCHLGGAKIPRDCYIL